MAYLYEIVDEFKQLAIIADEEEIDAEVLADTLEGLKGELEVKAEGYCQFIAEFEAKEKALKAESERLKSKADVIANNVKRMKEALKNALIDTGNEKGLDAGTFTLKVKGNGGVRAVDIIGEVPGEFTKIKIENDLTAIRKHLEELEKKGISESWATLKPRGNHLEIK